MDLIYPEPQKSPLVVLTCEHGYVRAVSMKLSFNRHHADNNSLYTFLYISYLLILIMQV
jgi:hypothetical protein